MNKKNNAKSQATHALIKEVFLALSQKKDAEKISIREICDAAGINRSSFYLHFTDLYDLIDEVEKDMTQQIESILLQAFEYRNMPMRDVFTSLFTFLRDHQSFFRAYYQHRRGAVRSLDLTKTEPFRSYIIDAGHQFGFESEREIRYHSLFFTSGFSAIMEQWLLDGCPESPEYLSELIYKEYRQ